MSATEIDRTLQRVAHEIVERSGGTANLALIGVRRRGVPLANRIAHAQIVRELEARGELVTTPAGEVAIDTGPLATAVLRALDGNGIRLFDAIPASALNQQFVLFRSTALVRARHATHALDELATWLPDRKSVV